MTASLFRLGQVLRGRLRRYTITKELQERTVWSATNQADEMVVIKGAIDHPRVENERNLLQQFQHRTPYLRQMIDEIQEPEKPVTIVLKHLDDHLQSASKAKKLNPKENKYVAKCVLEALKVLHDDGYVHADVKHDNVFLDYKKENTDENGIRFSNVQLGDLGTTYPVTSKYAKQGMFAGTTMWASPEILLETPWTTAADIWSFGALVMSLFFGGFNIFQPKDVRYGDPDYNLEVLMQQFRYFGPFPGKYDEIASPETINNILYVMQEIPASKTTSFNKINPEQVGPRDRDFILKIMKLDWRDRPRAQQLLDDEWFKEDR